MKIAIVSTGLGHVSRGIEAWALGMARGLGEDRCQRTDVRDQTSAQPEASSDAKAMGDESHRGGQAVSSEGGDARGQQSSFAASPSHGRTEGRGQAKPEAVQRGGQVISSCESRDSVEVTLFGSRGTKQLINLSTQQLQTIEIPSLKRGDAFVRAWVKMAPGFTWRWGWKSGYAIEQKSFAKHLIPLLQSGDYDVVHTQDIILAIELENARKKGIIKTPTIIAHGTDETMELLDQLEFVQHVSPFHLPTDTHRYTQKQAQWIIPNFVDTKRFCPGGVSRQDAKSAKKEREEIRAQLGVPSDALVIGCSAALQFHHKRLDYLIREMSSLNHIHRRVSAVPFLLLAGASTDETDQVEALARKLLGDRYRILMDLPFNEMPDFYRSLDIYVHPASEEFFGICFLEAMACGVPVVAHDSETLRWIVGVSTSATNNKQLTTLPKHSGGACLDMNEEGAVAGFLREVTPEWIEAHGRQARERVEKVFSWEAVEPMFLDMYRTVKSSKQ